MTSGDVETWDRLSDVYTRDRSLTPPERSLLAALWERWTTLDMLDLGVGAGRTAYTFAAIARSYVGVDFSPRMIDRARKLVGEDDRTSFVVGDARDLSAWYGRDFGVVLFSFNGIDAVGFDDRRSILAEVRKVIADEGVFAFSSHSLHALPFDARLRGPSPREIRRTVGLARANRSVNLEEAWERGWAVVRDDAHDFSLVLCYVSPAQQVEELARAGFVNCEVLDMNGRRVDAEAPGRDPHLFYVARPDSRGATMP